MVNRRSNTCSTMRFDRGSAIAFIVALTGLALTLIAWHNTVEQERLEAENVLESHAARVSHELARALTHNGELLFGTAGLFAASNRVEPDEFSVYVRAVTAGGRFAGLRGVALLRPAPASEASTSGVRAEYVVDNDGDAPSGWSHPAMLAALRPLGNPGATSAQPTRVVSVVPLNLSTESGDERALLLLPLGQRGGRHTGADGDVGWLAAKLSVPDLAIAASDDLPKGVSVTMSVARLVTAGTSGVNAPQTAAAPESTRTARVGTPIEQRVVYGGAEWRVRVTPGEAFIAAASGGSSNMVLAVGLALTVLAGASIFTLAENRRRADELAKVMEARATESESRFASIAFHLPGAVYRAATDRARTILWCSEGLAKLTGRSVADLTSGQVGLQELVAAVDAEKAAKAAVATVNAALGGGSPSVESTYCMYRLHAAGGHGPWVQDRATARRLPNGDLVTEGILIDVSDRVEWDRRLNQQAAELDQRAHEMWDARQSAERASHAKTLFLANMSHEIRTPMTAIIGYADLLENAKTAADRESYLRIIRSSGRHLLALINDVLDFSKIENGELLVERLDIDPAALVQEAVALLRHPAQDKSIALKLEFAGPMPPSFRTDPTRLRQVLVNLIANAIKFTSRGEVAVRVGADRIDQGARLWFEICDTGIGMTEAQLGRLFKPFAQADASTTRQFGGTGLGLSIAKSLAVVLGGDVQARSTPDVGSVFTVTVVGAASPAADWATPRAEIEQPAPTLAAPSKVNLTGLRVLIVDDVGVNRDLVAAVLQDCGAVVDQAEDGAGGVEAALAAARAGRAHHLVLMDMQMPGMDGPTATAMLRSNGFMRPVIALTANALASDRDACLSAGCNGFLTKPIEFAALIAMCERCRVNESDFSAAA